MANLTTRKLKSHNSAPEDAERKQKKKAKQDERASSQDADLPKTSEGPEDVVKPLLRRSVRVQQQKTKPDAGGGCGSGSAGVVSTTPDTRSGDGGVFTPLGRRLVQGEAPDEEPQRPKKQKQSKSSGEHSRSHAASSSSPAIYATEGDANELENAMAAHSRWTGDLPSIGVPWPLSQMLIRDLLKVYVLPAAEANNTKSLPTCKWIW